MANDALNVTTGRPKVGGAIHRAALGSTLPVDASSALDAAFKSLGYVSEDGVTNSNSPESESIKAWGGDTVSSFQTGKEDTFQLTLIEAMSEDVLKAVYGATNVTKADGKLTIIANSDEQESACWVIDMVLKGEKLKRIVIPNGKISAVGDVVYKDNEAIGYQITITAVAYTDEAGKTGTHWEYIE